MQDDQNIPLDDSPGVRIQAAIARFGEPVVADRAASLLSGANEGDAFLLWVGGRHAQGILDGAPALYWPEVWGARALLYAWDDADAVAASVLRGLANQAWRVREMCARVVAARELAYPDKVVELLTDDNARVRAMGAKALAATGEYEHAVLVKKLLKDPEVEVRRAAGDTLRAMSARLDREIE